MDFIRNHKLIVATIAIQIIALPLILLLVKEQQQTQTQAQATTLLYFNPTSSPDTPIQAEIGQNISLDLMLDPSENLISFAKIEINYDPSSLQPVDPINPVTVNTNAFPVTIEQKAESGKILIAISVGSDQTKVIQNTTKVLTVNLKAIGETNQTTDVDINQSNTQLLSTAPQDTATENVLSTATPAVIQIAPAVIADTTPPTITGPTVSDTTQISTAVNWSVDEGASGQVQYGTTTSYGKTSTLEACCNSQNFAQSLTGLTPDTLYHYRVVSTDEAGNTATSSDHTFTTLPAPDTTPPTITGPTVSDTTQISTAVNWSVDEGASGQVQYGTTTSYGKTSTLEACCNSQNFAQSLTGLTPDTLYHYRVVSTDEAGNTATSSDHTFRTLAEISTIFNINGLKLHGLGSGGDNPNPTSWGTLNPLRTSRILTLQLYNSSGVLTEEASGTITYSGPTTGVFNGSVAVPDTLKAGENYYIKLSSPYYLSERVPGFIQLVAGNTYDVAPVALVAGDVDLSSSLKINDYDIIMDCYSDLAPAQDCDENKKQAADISDDGLVNQDDYNLFLRELSVQTGD